MANELQISAQIDFSAFNASTSANAFVNSYVSSSAYANGTQDITTTATAVDFQGIAEPGYVMIQNLDESNIIEIGWIDSAAVKIYPIRLHPGSSTEPGMFTILFNNSYAAIYAKLVNASNNTAASAKIGIIAFNKMNDSATRSIITLSVSEIPNDDTTLCTVTVTLISSTNSPVTGKTVTLASSRSGGIDTIATTLGTTNASGQATFTVKSATIGTMELTATNTTDSVTVAAVGVLNVVTA